MNSQLSPQEGAKILLRRRQTRKNLISWARHCGYEPAPHHKLIIEKLERVARGEISRLALFLPPGSAKSTYTSVLFLPWLLANEPQAAIIAASHTVELAEKWGRRVRNLVSEYPGTLGLALSADSQAAGRWALPSGGEYFAAGVGVGIAGFRADLAIIDDPVRSGEDADSEIMRNRTWDWFKSDLSTRMKPGGRTVLIQTRWHEDDLAGRILAEMERGGDRWEVLSLPAEAEANDPLGRKPGEFLWDDDYGYAKFLAHHLIVSPHNHAINTRPDGHEWAFYARARTLDAGAYTRAVGLPSRHSGPEQLWPPAGDRFVTVRVPDTD